MKKIPQIGMLALDDHPQIRFESPFKQDGDGGIGGEEEEGLPVFP